MTLRIEHDVPLAPRTTLELGGPARHFARVDNDTDIAEALRWAAERELPARVLGGGSNLIVPDAGFAGLVLDLGFDATVEARGEGAVRLEVGAGVEWDTFVAHAVARGYAGVECLGGIPGRVGATPIQNVGAYGQEVCETILSVRAFDRDSGVIRDLSAEDCAFAYRDSALKREPERWVVLSVTFELRPGGEPAVRYAELERSVGPSPTLAQVHETVIELRRRKSMVLDPQDPNRRSAGSFFTNPIVAPERAARVVEVAVESGLVEQAGQVPQWAQADGRVKLAAGWLIERAGMTRGTRRGRVGISDRHALALVHHGGGTTAELLALADEVIGAVEARFGVVLVREPVLWG